MDGNDRRLQNRKKGLNLASSFLKLLKNGNHSNPFGVQYKISMLVSLEPYGISPPLRGRASLLLVELYDLSANRTRAHTYELTNWKYSETMSFCSLRCKM